MDFNFKEIGEQDKEKIISDSKRFKKLTGRFNQLQAAGNARSLWVVNSRQDSYLIPVPKLFREEEAELTYMFRFKEQLVMASFKNCFLPVVSLSNNSSESEGMELKDSFVQALLVEIHSGLGPTISIDDAKSIKFVSGE